MNSLKKIRLFENEPVAQGVARRPGEVVIPAKTIQNINVFRMIEIDMYFFFYGAETIAEN